jgi:hypothetical protein
MTDARRAWEAHPKPTLRAVVQALAVQGLSCSVETLRRWKIAGWISKNTHPHEITETIIKTVAHWENSCPDDIQAQIEREEANVEQQRETLVKIDNTTLHLTELEIRETLAARIIMTRQISKHAHKLVRFSPEIAAKLLAVLKMPNAPTTVVIAPQNAHPYGNGATVVQGRVVGEKTPTQIAIEAFKNRNRSGAA